MNESEDIPTGSMDFRSAAEIADAVANAGSGQHEHDGNTPEAPGLDIKGAREHLAEVVAGMPEPAVPASPEVNTEESRRDRGLGGPTGASEVPLSPERELEMTEVVDKQPRGSRAMAALLRAGRRMEEGALNIAAKLIVGGKNTADRSNEKAADKRREYIDRKLKRMSPEDLREEDEGRATYYEGQRLFLLEPSDKRSIDVSHRYQRWTERRTPDDPAVAEAVAAAEAPIQAQIDDITATELFGINYQVSDMFGNFRTPWEYRDSHYEWKKGDARATHFQEVQANNARLRQLVEEKLAARKAVLAEHSGWAEVQ